MNRRELLAALGTAPVATAALRAEETAPPKPAPRKWAEIRPRESRQKR